MPGNIVVMLLILLITNIGTLFIIGSSRPATKNTHSKKGKENKCIELPKVNYREKKSSRPTTYRATPVSAYFPWYIITYFIIVVLGIIRNNKYNILLSVKCIISYYTPPCSVF